MEKEEITLTGKIIGAVREFLNGQFDLQTNDPGFRVMIQENVAVVKFTGLLSKAEQDLAKTPSGLEMVKKVYYELFDNNSPLLECMIKNAIGVDVRNIQVEIDPQYSESILIVNFKENIN